MTGPFEFHPGGLIQPRDTAGLARDAVTMAWDRRAVGDLEGAAAALDRAAKIGGLNVYGADAAPAPAFRDPAAELADARAAGEHGMSVYRQWLRRNAAEWAREHAADPDLQTSAAVWAELAALPL